MKSYNEIKQFILTSRWHSHDNMVLVRKGVPMLAKGSSPPIIEAFKSYGDVVPRREVGEDDAFNKN